uniref:matrixin family metalloprotease n=1 Tax=Roseovarius conchicola TaxID=3121636 RepID=UPI0035292619
MANPGGSSWGSTPSTLGDAGGVVTWSIAGGGENISEFGINNGNSIDPASAFQNLQYENLIRQSFEEWSRYGNIEFMQVEDTGGAAGQVADPDIRIFFGDIPGSTLGVAYFPPFGGTSALAGDIVLDTVSWLDNAADTFKGLALHEIGHALGLGHVDQNVNSVMTPSLSQTSLQQDDINGIRQVYGTQDNAPAVYNMASGQAKLNILNSPAKLTVNGNNLNNEIDGTDTAETFNGGGGADTLLGQGGSDRLDGGGGNDQLFGGAGADRIFGGDGADLIRAGFNFGTSVDGVEGGAGNDTIFGDAGFDLLRGGGGNDGLNGGNHADNLYGEDGNDTLDGGNGFDRL